MTGQDKWTFIDRSLQERRQEGRLRSLQRVEPLSAVEVKKGDRALINFSCNDYLGLSKHPLVVNASREYAQRYGAGATASRLVAGTYSIHQELEEKLAIACGREAALLFNSGFQCNATVLSALLDREALVLGDRLIHSSLLQGILSSRCRFQRYHHNDLPHLESLLAQSMQQSYSRVVIVTETVFSMDGDRSDVDALVELANQYNAILYLDDAHAVGVLGRDGMGLAAHRPDVDVVVGTFGKAFGAFGAFVAGSAKLRDYLVNCCPGFIYTTALPPAVIGAIAAALELMPSLEQERQYLSELGDRLRSQLHQLGYATAASSTQIVPIVVGEEQKTLRLSAWLEECGILAIAIRPPTVPPGTARIRIALSAEHTEAHLDQLIYSLKNWHDQG